jgi:hypothetical protein
VDKVIGLAWGDSIKEQWFKDNFNTDFLIKNYDPVTFFRLTNRFPVAYYIQNDTVKRVIRGELPCGYVFSKKIEADSEKLNK